ncbi:MAG: acyl-CoA thioesterase [Opitutae bacterium]|jgi:YbgC/YbaW family acyl-CoA thioester hydrolase|nr:acyl-CoA thioesterase [Opitutae bacterium]MBT4224015.1 acyl-CoA thioesterase [Opitutae bacterium]MBT5379398.1 acyl-CoA thioesterase [Opitutae bacterium]MBT5692822.1 acyl-CoA thioesterase [Opitutae bacterium]MBT6463777.1 acyl-CoA thioesterase [Opitutae bacterium]
MAMTYSTTRRVEFAETDMAGIMHFSNFYRWMETVEHEFFRSLGLSIHMRIDDQDVGWPRLETSCKFKRPLKFEEEATVRLSIEEISAKTITYSFKIEKEENGQQLHIARGKMTTVCVTFESGTGKLKAIPIPKIIREKIDP